jgi:hypothetical protein
MQGSMKLYLDVTAQSFMVTAAPKAKIADRKTGVQKSDHESGLPMWTTELMAMGADGAPVIAVTTASAAVPQLAQGKSVVPEGLEALPWSNKDRDGELRMGIAFRAKALHAAQVPASV